MKLKKLKGFLLAAFAIVAPVTGGVALLHHENEVAKQAVVEAGYATPNYTDTGILWGDRHGAPITGSGTEFQTLAKDGTYVKGVVHHPFFGKPDVKISP